MSQQTRWITNLQRRVGNKRSRGQMGLSNQTQAVATELGKTPLPRAVEILFEPVARMLVCQGIGGNSTLEIIKRAYVTATINVLKERGQPVTPARLRIFTGFPGREVERLQQQSETQAALEPSKFDQVTKLLTTWHLDDRYSLQFGGTPRELRIGRVRDEYTFASLAQECAPTLDPTELLKELVDLGAVQLSEDQKRVRPVARAYLPEPLSSAANERLGRMVRNFTETLDWNFQTQDPENRRVDRHVSADFAISPEDENAFRLKARKEGQALLESLDSWLQQQKAAPENGRRVGLVLFQYLEDAGNHGTPANGETVNPDEAKSNRPDLVGPEPIDDQGGAEDGVIDVLNYRGPKK
jgi:hypothetical protein